jgi:hypothetical protein
MSTSTLSWVVISAASLRHLHVQGYINQIDVTAYKKHKHKSQCPAHKTADENTKEGNSVGDMFKGKQRSHSNGAPQLSAR